MSKPRRIYVGIRPDLSRERFWSESTPQRHSHPQYLSVLGPFRTVGAATLAVMYGPTPAFQSVQDYERAFAVNPDRALAA